MGNEEVDLVTVVKPQEKRSLLKKYDIPVEHLSYEFITDSTNVKELEKIVQILRSGEEGIFPDLIKHAEKCLAKFSPKSKILRIEEPVVTRAMLDPDDRKLIDNDIAEWMNDMQGREKDLEEGKTLSSILPIPQPEIRQFFEESKSSSNSRNKKPKAKSIASCDYEGWDKFDADAELDRIDLQEERKRVGDKNVQKIRREKLEEAKNYSRESIVNKVTLTATELTVMADQERNIGNEAYRSGDYEEALIRYNSSISINSTINAYNNRAITNIKLQRYQDAVNDCNHVLSMECNNVTALMRRGLALEYLERKSQALVDYQTILIIEPNNKIAIAAVNKLIKPSDSKKVRMKIEEEENSVENEIREELADSMKEKSKIDVRRENRISEICFCDRAPGFSQSPKPPPHYKSSYCLSSTSNFEKSRNFSQTKSEHSFFSDIKNNESPKLIIEELTSITNEPTCKSKNQKTDMESKEFRAPTYQQKKIDVATKYEKATVRDSGEKISTKDFDSIESPYEFLHVWQSLKNDIDLSLHAKLLRSITPEDLHTVIGNKLDGSMFSTILRCLERHFCIPENVGLIHRFISSLKNLTRFSIVRLFMDKDDKKVLLDIVNFLNDHISPVDAQEIRQAYNI